MKYENLCNSTECVICKSPTCYNPPKRENAKHEHPNLNAKKEERSLADAISAAEKLEREMPFIVQILPSDWDKIILADEVKRLRSIIEKSYH